MTLPDESRDQIGKSQETWNWLVHPQQNGGWYAEGGSGQTLLPPAPGVIGLKLCQDLLNAKKNRFLFAFLIGHLVLGILK